MPRDRVPSLFRGIPLDPTPRPRGLASGLEGLVPRGRSPGAPLFLLVRVTNHPQPLSSTTYLRGEEVCLASRLGQIDVAEAN